MIRIQVAYADFDDFWDSNSLPSGPQGVLIHNMPPGEKDKLRSFLREQVPVVADGRVIYKAFANAVKGRVPQ